MGKDTDGTEWRTVRYTVDVQVMADNDQDALYFGALSDEMRGADVDRFTAEVLG